jgi:lipase ATG15
VQAQFHLISRLDGYYAGGGLAIVTGAKTGVQAVAISGPNAMISRQRFGVTAEDLETYTFNIIPDRDPVAMIDDPSKNLQRIECRASQTDFMSCHNIVRSLCEAQYICGSGNRPVLCDCATKFDYPEPIPRNGTTSSFRDVCSES